jgi:hypothetical protein
VELTLYVRERCSGCARARALVTEMAALFRSLHVSIVDLSRPEAPIPEAIFATPTYSLDGRVISLGNPTRDRLMRDICEALAKEERR